MAFNGNHNPRALARRRWIVWAVGIAAAILVLAAFMSMRDDSVPVRVAMARRENIRSVISTNGKVEPINNDEVHAPIATSVKRVLVKEGDHVKKGQLLVQLGNAQAREAAARALAQIRGSQANVSAMANGGTQEEVLTNQADLVKAQSTADTARRNLQALEQLQHKGAASPGEVAAAQSELARAQADLQLLQKKQNGRFSKLEVEHVQAQQNDARAAYDSAREILDGLDIRAPFDGEVYSLPVRPGQYLNPGDMVLQMADLSHVLVRTFVDEPDIGRLSLNQPVEVTWDALPGRIWTGQVNSTPAGVKLRGTRNVGEITTVVENPDRKLLPNVNVGVTIVTAEHKNALTVPRESVRQYDSKVFVFQVVNDQLHRRDVQTAISNLTDVEITSGLQDDALVAVSSTNSKPLKGGMAVKVVR